MSELLTTTEYLILKSVQLLSGKGYGVLIRAEIKAKAGQDFSYGTIYKVLRRLERKGFVSSYKGEKTEERGGRAKEYFSIKGLGQRALTETESAIVAFGGVPTVKPVSSYVFRLPEFADSLLRDAIAVRA